jgi:hypothetical protein
MACSIRDPWQSISGNAMATPPTRPIATLRTTWRRYAVIGTHRAGTNQTSDSPRLCRNTGGDAAAVDQTQRPLRATLRAGGSVPIAAALDDQQDDQHHPDAMTPAARGVAAFQ